MKIILLPATDASVGGVAHATSSVAVVLEQAANKQREQLMIYTKSPQDKKKNKLCLSTAVLV